ncbi:MAG: DUF4294 domain-containing protein [Bacteroidales bacterium]|jgi:hypothetical protein|nr:DUF4294 domain-containing protein [Bacteroidales bacterium]
MKRIFFITIFFLLILGTTLGQEVKYTVLNARIIDGDTVPFVRLKEVEIYSLKIPKTRRGQKQLTKLVKNIKIVYPYAKLAGIKLQEYEDLLVNASTDKERKQIMKRAEAEINEEYGGELKELTFSQGKILIKLIDRETGDSSYELVQELRGKFTAFWYQAFARIWGYNLKEKYDPKGDDRQIEIIVRMIESGQL